MEREDIKEVSATPKGNSGILTVESTSGTKHEFRLPQLVFEPLVDLLKEQQLLGSLDNQSSSSEAPVDDSEANPTDIESAPDADQSSSEDEDDLDESSPGLTLAKSLDFRDPKKDDPTLKLKQVDADIVSGSTTSKSEESPSVAEPGKEETAAVESSSAKKEEAEPDGEITADLLELKDDSDSNADGGKESKESDSNPSEKKD